MKAFTHGFTDSVSPDNGSNHPFFVNGGWCRQLFKNHVMFDPSPCPWSWPWQPGQSSTGLSMICFWWTGTPWHKASCISTLPFKMIISLKGSAFKMIITQNTHKGDFFKMIISHKESGISQILIMTRLRTMRLMWEGEDCCKYVKP